MFVCICRGVTSDTIQKAMTDGAQTVGDLSMVTGAGTCCGACVDTLHTMLAPSEQPPVLPVLDMASETPRRLAF